MTTKRKILWIGGSSQLARSYYSTYGLADSNEDELYLCGVEPTCPFPLISANASYFSLDLTTLTSSSVNHDDSPLVPEELQEVLDQEITSIIVSIRPVLVTSMSNEGAWEYNKRILDGLKVVLKAALATGSIRHMVHISSVAAVNHLQAQINQGEEDDEYLHCAANLEEGNDLAPYDRFKRQSEVLISTICTSEPAKNVLFTNLRISGLLFEEGRCIVAQSFALQARLGLYQPAKIDVNPARNVAAAILLIMSKMDKLQQCNSSNSSLPVAFAPLYYYTRPTLMKDPLPLSHITALYRSVCDMQWWECFWTPFWLYVVFIYSLCYLAALVGNILPYAQAVDYLLRVGLLEHSFDNTRFQTHFPEISKLEISIKECFQMRHNNHRRQKDV